VNLLKAVILGGLWPRVARIHFPATKSEKIPAGTIQGKNTARKFQIIDLRKGRVSLNPASVLSGGAAWKSHLLVFFEKYMSTNGGALLRDATEVFSPSSSHLHEFY
jgi:ATP-dependent RNA helicase DHX57